MGNLKKDVQRLEDTAKADFHKALVWVTNMRDHVINLLSGKTGGEAIHLLPGIPQQVPVSALHGPLDENGDAEPNHIVKGMVDAGILTIGKTETNEEAAAAVKGIDFSSPDTTKANRAAQRSAAASSGPQAEAGVSGAAVAPVVPPAPDTAPAAGSAVPPWQA